MAVFLRPSWAARVFYGIDDIDIFSRANAIFKTRNLTIRLPEQVPEKIAQSFELLVPVLVMIATLYPLSLLVQHFTGMLVPEVIMAAFKPFVAASDSLTAILICVLISHLLWFCGIHGAAIVTNLLQPFWLANIAANQTALELGQVLPHSFVDPFWRFYIVIGAVVPRLRLSSCICVVVQRICVRSEN